MKINIIRRLLLLLPSCLAVAVSAFGQSDTLSSALRDCDLLFQVNPRGNAITDVTSGVDGLAIDHVAIFVRLDGRPSVIEALPERGVCITPVDSFLGRRRFADGRPAVVVGRVEERLDCAKTIAAALSYVGCRYDSLYLPDNDEIYCSELVLLSFVDSTGCHIFKPIPMTFRDSTGRIPDYWTEFYARHGMPVPEGRPGSNPGELSRRVGAPPRPSPRGGCLRGEERLSDE